MVDFYSVAGALSRFLAGFITEYLDGARGIAGWRWLFVSLCFGIVETILEMSH
jgi:MFS family permease